MVDTGIHALGWSRDRALAFLQDHTALGQANLEVSGKRESVTILTQEIHLYGGLGMFVFTGMARIKSVSVNFNGENSFDIGVD